MNCSSSNCYFITAVSYRPYSFHIDSIWVYRLDEGKQKLVYDGQMTRDQFISYIKSGFEFYTIIQEEGQVRPGATVRLVRLFGKEYLRIDTQAIEEDNLGALPEYWNMGVFV